MLSEKHHNPHRGGTEAYLATEHFNEGWNQALVTVRKVLGSSLAASIHYPECWDTAAYPTIESALAETGEDFQCTNDDCPHHAAQQQSEPGAFNVPATLQFDNAALAAEIEWCLGEGHCGPRTRAVLQRIRDHQTAGTASARRPMLLITLRQAENLERFFGGHDAEVAVVPYKDGLLAWDIECPEQGSQWLGPTAVDDELADKGRPDTSRPAIWKTTHPAVCVPLTDSPAIAEGWKEHGYDVVEFYPGPQKPRVCTDMIGTAAPHADGNGPTVLCATAGAVKGTR
ncbi:hypothetical protein GO285_01384 [Ralstonia solanacearum]|nr:hypothetical protein [Ralstonia solanacearum]NKG09609.1 hypothetical protein [Ralstonia solanacearum]